MVRSSRLSAPRREESGHSRHGVFGVDSTSVYHPVERTHSFEYAGEFSTVRDPNGGNALRESSNAGVHA